MPTTDAPVYLQIRVDGEVVRAFVATKPQDGVAAERMEIATIATIALNDDPELFEQWKGCLARHMERQIRKILERAGINAKVTGTKQRKPPPPNFENSKLTPPG